MIVAPTTKRPNKKKSRPEKLEQPLEDKRKDEAEINSRWLLRGKTWKWLGVEQRSQFGLGFDESPHAFNGF
ncbi:hypothetical protein [Rhizobium ruizarguesonis]|uniref:hypothetical protein n=1 Tax=Rhizobium ruizarguesonis TaxID=2081791 RepID=UPI001FDFC02D|nr:hypothetical protein [Rhizobium ruizarguesonis]